MASDLDRREFLKGLGAAALAASTGALSGCGRLLDWSGGERTGLREMSPASPEPTGSEPTGGAEATSSGSTTKGTASPDLVVARGADPAANVRKAVEALGGMERFVKRGGRVVLKPNLLTGREPQYAVSTNPAVMGALTALCLQAGAAEVVVLDHSTSEASTAFQVSGIEQAVRKAGGRVKYLTDRNFDQVRIPQGRLLTSWPLVSDIFEADTFINVPIAKTHGMAVLTMAMKNLMGIMGGMRGAIHVDFDTKIVDLNSLVRPHLVLLDATRILVRNGPTGGSLDDVELRDTVVAGTNQASVDAYGTTLFGMKPTDLAYLVNAQRRGIGETDLKKLRITRVGG
jgi:uncharacterized protein (DUF362 family)